MSTNTLKSRVNFNRKSFSRLILLINDLLRMLIESLILSVSVMNHYEFIMGGISICLLRHEVN